MRFARLYLTAYGAFKDRLLEFPQRTSHDFHLIFGPNEAGKSTLLRAVTAFLFGMPHATDDAFLHEYSALRVGATVQMPDGTSLSAMRRKARKATLFPINEATGAELTDAPIPERISQDLTGGLDMALYQNLFGLDLDHLVEGSESLLQGEGEIGHSLFQAASGLANLRAVISELDAQAAESFKPRGIHSRLNRALEELQEQRRILRDTTVRTPQWESAERVHRQAADAHQRLRDTLKERRARREHLLRIQSNLPLVAERASKQAEVQSLMHLPLLRPDAAQQRVSTLERLRVAQESAQTAQARLEQLKTDLSALRVRTEVLHRAGAIEQVYHAIKNYRAARDALPRIQRQRGEVHTHLTRLLAELGHSDDPAGATQLLPSETLVARVDTLIDEQGKLSARDEQLDTQIRTKAQQLKHLEERLARLPAPLSGAGDLERTLGQLAGLPEQESRARRLQRDTQDEDMRLQSEARRLWPGDLSGLVRLTVPVPEIASSFEAAFTGQVQEERRVSEQDQTLTRQLQESRRELEVLASTGEVVTQAEVSAARTRRDSRWTQLKTHLQAQAAPAPDARPLAADFEAALREADRLADLLHADTARATRLEGTRQQIAQRQAEMQRNETRRAELLTRREDLERRWAALVAPLQVSDLTPAALREWLTRHQRIVERFESLKTQRAELAQMQADIARAREQLSTAMHTCGLALAADEPFSAALTRAHQALAAARRAREDREVLTRQLEAGRGELDVWHSQRQQLATKLTTWQGQWTQVCQQLQLPADALPAEARVRLEQLARLKEGLAQLTQLETDTRERRTLVDSFQTTVSELVRETAPPSADTASASLELEPPDALAGQLYGALEEARRADTRRRQLMTEREHNIRALREAEAAAQQAGSALEELVRQAGCQRIEQLPEIEQKVAHQQLLKQRLREIDEQLVRQNAQSLEEVLKETGAWTLDAVAREIAESQGEIEELDLQLDAAQQSLFSARQQLDAINGGTAAAEAQQAWRSAAAHIGRESRTYARARLASAILGRVVQAYREQHQGPLLRRSGDVFARITRGSFAGLTVDYNQDGRQVLLGVRADSSQVPISGMSQGTRDQLYLSLRLAAIEQHIEGRGPFPVIVDDLLVQFDDARSLATLEVLSELSTRTQVLFFTHHHHLVALAQGSKLAQTLSVQTL